VASSGSEREREYEVVYTEAIRALDLQRAAFDALRARVGFLLSAATIATSFLGGLALQDSGSIGSWGGVILFVAFGAVALRLLWPRAEGADGFTFTPSIVIGEYLEREGDTEPVSLNDLYRDLALFCEEAHNRNRDAHLVPLTNFFRLAIVLLTAEIAAWVVDLGSR
jgi:hypothetical protein